MSSSVDNNEIPAEGLTTDNQEKWRRCVEKYLGDENLWDAVSGAFARPPDGDETLEEWTRKNDAALLAIRNSSGSHYAHHLREVLEAKRAWEILTHIHDDPPVHVKVLIKQIYADNLEGVRETLEQHKGALIARVDDSGQTALHMAAQVGHLRIVELITRLHSDDLLIPDDDGFTSLSSASLVGVSIGVARTIYEANSDTLITPDDSKRLPVTLAFGYGHTHLGLHLYTATIQHLRLPDGTLRIHNLPNGRDLAANLLGSCFVSQKLGIALDFLSIPGNQYLLLEEDNDGKSAIERIATLQGRDWPANELLNKVCENEGLLAKSYSHAASGALFLAACQGNVEFVKRVVNAYPTLIVLSDSETEWNIFFYAVAYRQAKIFDHIRVLRLKDMLASIRDDVDSNTLLHVAAKLDPPAKLKLGRITGPALQMQRKLQWFKKVESVVPEWVKEYKNDKDLTPRELFKETHKELRKEGEEWMKGAATSGSVVAALVVTIMFTVAFTVPGGLDSNNGLPPLRDKQRKWFMTFIFSDAISLLFSTTSVLTFLTILTSRFDEEDFLMSLPTKLICGFSTLFVSIITMFIAFSANIVMMLHKTSYLWVYPPIILLAIVLVIFFGWLHFSSFYEIICSTYFPHIFNKEVKPWLLNVFNEERDRPRAIDEGHDLIFNHIHPGPAPPRVRDD